MKVPIKSIRHNFLIGNMAHKKTPAKLMASVLFVSLADREQREGNAEKLPLRCDYSLFVTVMQCTLDAQTYCVIK
jgi:hypothetical protein